MRRFILNSVAAFLFAMSTVVCQDAHDVQSLKQNVDGRGVELRVGSWVRPVPTCYDGENDLILSCPYKPYRGTYFF